MNQQRPIDLLEKFLQGKCTREEEQLVHEWYESLGKGRLTLADNEDSEEARKQRIYAIVKERIYSDTELSSSPYSLTPRRYYMAAAAIALLISAVSLMFFSVRQQNNSFELATTTSVIERTNDTQKDLALVLPDGSHVILSSGALVSYPSKFGDNVREVILEGEAFFDVKRDTLKPFRVHTGNVTTQVLGTSFTIRSPGNDDAINVIVRTGRVSVYKGHAFGDHPDAVVLTPNQQVSYQKEKEILRQSVIAQPIPLIADATGSSAEFENVPVQDVLEKLIRLYGINIRTANKNILSCPITASFENQTLYTRVEMICKAIGATYSINETEIIIEGGACE